MLNQLPLALQLTAVIKNSLQACFSVVLLANEGARALRKYKVGWKTFINKWCYFIFVPPYLFAPSLIIKKREEKICEKSLVTSPLPLVTHCPDLSLSLVVFVEGTSLWPQVWLFWCPFTNFYVPYGEKRTFFRFPCIPFCNLWGFFGKDLFKLITGLWECSEKERLESDFFLN